MTNWADDGGLTVKFENWWTGKLGTQGASISGNTVFLSRGHKGEDYMDAYHLGVENKLSSRVGRWRVPNGPEDLHISSGGHVWGCTEFPEERFIFYGDTPNC